MIIRHCDECFVVKVLKSEIGDFNIFDIDDIKCFFKDIFKNITKNYDLHGLIDANVYVNNDYGMIVELVSINSCFDELDIDVKIKMHLNNVFLVEIDSYYLLDYDDVYYYNDKFYGVYNDLSDGEIIYKDTEEIIDKGIKVC